MDWKTDSDLNESEVEPYSSFQSTKSGKLFDRMELPIILIGAGLLALVIFFVLFIPKKNEVTIDDYRHLASRLDQLENKIEDLTEKNIDIRVFDPSKDPVQYQQVINWIKSNAEVISETIKKVDEIEKNIKNVPKIKPVVDVKPRAKKSVQPKQKMAEVTKSPEKPKPIAKSKLVEKPQPATESKPLEKSKSVQIQPKEKSKPKIQSKPEGPPKTVVSAPKPKVQAKPEVQVKPVVETKPIVEAKSVIAKPETVKLIFHRVEKGETLYRISKNYGISVEELQELNDMKNDDLIIDIGQELIIRKEKQ